MRILVKIVKDLGHWLVAKDVLKESLKLLPDPWYILSVIHKQRFCSKILLGALSMLRLLAKIFFLHVFQRSFKNPWKILFCRGLFVLVNSLKIVQSFSSGSFSLLFIHSLAHYCFPYMSVPSVHPSICSSAVHAYLYGSPFFQTARLFP